jgi:hypothetical protein
VYLFRPFVAAAPLFTCAREQVWADHDKRLFGFTISLIFVTFPIHMKKLILSLFLILLCTGVLHAADSDKIARIEVI